MLVFAYSAARVRPQVLPTPCCSSSCIRQQSGIGATTLMIHTLTDFEYVLRQGRQLHAV